MQVFFSFAFYDPPGRICHENAKTLKGSRKLSCSIIFGFPPLADPGYEIFESK